jgi:hypothetical protein
MNDGESAATAHDWEWSAEVERGVSIGTGAKWSGHRVRYRDRGTRRWRSFLLSVDGDVTPTDAMIVRAIEAHAGQ